MPKPRRFSVLSGGLARESDLAYEGEDGDVNWDAVRIGFRRGDLDAIGHVSHLILGQLRYHRAPAAEMEDLEMETLKSLYANRDREITGSYSAYVRRAATNKFLDWCRRNARASFETLDDEGHQAPDLLEAVSEAALRRCLEQLDARHRRIIENKFFAGRSDEEIAEALEISQSSVRRRIAEARSLLRKLMLD